MKRKKSLLTILSAFLVIAGLVYFYLSNTDDFKFGVIDFEEKDNQIEENSKDDGDEASNDNSRNHNENVQVERDPEDDQIEISMNPEKEKLREEFLRFNPGSKISEEDELYFDLYLKGQLFEEEKPWVNTKKPIFGYFKEHFSEAPQTISSESIGLRINRPSKRSDILPGVSMFALGPTMGDRYLTFAAFSGDSMGYINRTTGKEYVWDTGVNGFSVNPDKNEIIYAKSYGINGTEFIYDRIGPLNESSIKRIEEEASLVSGAFYKDLVFYTYAHKEKEDGDFTSGQGVFNILGSKSDEKAYQKILKKYNIDYFASDGEVLLGFDIGSKSLYDLSNGEAKLMKRFSEIETINGIRIKDGNYFFSGRVDGKGFFYSNLVDEPIEFPANFFPYYIINENIVIGTLSIDGRVLTIYNIKTGEYETITKVGSHTVIGNTIYITSDNDVFEIHFEELN